MADKMAYSAIISCIIRFKDRKLTRIISNSFYEFKDNRLSLNNIYDINFDKNFYLCNVSKKVFVQKETKTTAYEKN